MYVPDFVTKKYFSRSMAYMFSNNVASLKDFEIRQICHITNTVSCSHILKKIYEFKTLIFITILLLLIIAYIFVQHPSRHIDAQLNKISH